MWGSIAITLFRTAVSSKLLLEQPQTFKGDSWTLGLDSPPPGFENTDLQANNPEAISQVPEDETLVQGLPTEIEKPQIHPEQNDSG